MKNDLRHHGRPLAVALAGCSLSLLVLGSAIAQTTPPDSPREEPAPASDTVPSPETTAQDGQAADPQPGNDAVATIPVKSTDQDQEAPARSEERTQLDDIVVTATKREESPRKLASSVTAITGEEVENLGLQDVEDIVNQVPGLTFFDPQNNSPARITVRGVSPDTLTPATTGVFLDETPFNDTGVAVSVLDMNPFDLYTVEVLKGPVGTLFGGTGFNGAIRYIPQPPVMQEWGLKAYGEIGGIAEGGISNAYGAAVNVPVYDDKLALRLVAMDRTTSGFMDSVHPDYMAEDINTVNQNSQRAILRWQPRSDLDLSLMYVNQQTTLDDVLIFTELPDGQLERHATPRASPAFDEYQIYNLKTKWTLDWADVVVNVARLDKSGDRTVDLSYLADKNDPPPSAQVSTVFEGRSGIQEIRLVSAEDGGHWDWLIGGFNYTLDFWGDGSLEAQSSASEPPTVALRDEGTFKIEEQALFGEVNWRFIENFELTAGLRAYRFGYDNDVTTSGPGCVLVDPTCPANGFAAHRQPTAAESGTNPKLSLKWQAMPTVLTYATLSKGFRFGGVNSISRPDIPPVYKSDTLWNLEGGVRTEWFDNTLIADLTVFGIQWTDAQVLVLTADGSAGYVDNVGEVEGKGAEASVIWFTPVPGLRFSLTPAYVDLRTAEDYNSSAGPVPAGTRWPLAPELGVSTSLGWSTTLFDISRFEASVTHRYASEARARLTNTDQVLGFGTYGVQLMLQPLAGKYWPELAINLNNITDERGLTFKKTDTDGVVLRGYTAPRNATARLTFRF